MSSTIHTLERVGGYGFHDPDPIFEGDRTGPLAVAYAVVEGYAEHDPDHSPPFLVLTEAGWARLTRMLEVRYNQHKPSKQRELVDMCLRHVRECRERTEPLRVRLAAIMARPEPGS